MRKFDEFARIILIEFTHNSHRIQAPNYSDVGCKQKAPRKTLGAFIAERTGFEPANRFCRLHAFQACLFNHSSTSPS